MLNQYLTINSSDDIFNQYLTVLWLNLYTDSL
jgi:hypothetical protein